MYVLLYCTRMWVFTRTWKTNTMTLHCITDDPFWARKRDTTQIIDSESLAHKSACYTYARAQATLMVPKDDVEIQYD